MEAGDKIDRIMPIVAGTVSWPSGGAPSSVQIDLHDRAVELNGTGVADLLADCDGQTTVGQLVERHGPDAVDLVSGLIEAGALVDGSKAWRVYHRQSSAGSALGSGASADEILALQNRRWSPPGDGAVVALAPAASSVPTLAKLRSSMDPTTALALPDFAVLCELLSATAPANPPSAGGMYPVMAHVILRDQLGPLSPGTWWVNAADQTLRQTSEQAEDEAVRKLFIWEPGCQALLDRDGPVIFLSADLERPQQKYGARAYRFGLIEVGAAMQSASLAAADLELPLRVFGGIDDDAVSDFLGLPPDAVALLAMIVG